MLQLCQFDDSDDVGAAFEAPAAEVPLPVQRGGGDGSDALAAAGDWWSLLAGLRGVGVDVEDRRSSAAAPSTEGAEAPRLGGPKQTFCDQQRALAEVLEPAWKALKATVFQSDFLHAGDIILASSSRSYSAV